MKKHIMILKLLIAASSLLTTTNSHADEVSCFADNGATIIKKCEVGTLSSYTEEDGRTTVIFIDSVITSNQKGILRAIDSSCVIVRNLLCL